MKIKKNIFLPITVFVVLVLLSCAPQYIDAKSSKKSDPFFEKARFIMSKEEIDIYTHLADKEARDEFIEEFWKKRDPTPDTKENENREEFQMRIEFSNKWFKESTKGRGWDTERGRFLLQLGFPTRREFGQATIKGRRGRLSTSNRIPTEMWYYLQYQLVLVFQDTKNLGKYQLTTIPTNLLNSLNMAKFSLDLRDSSNIKRTFKFNVDYKPDKIHVRIPIKKVSFEEKNEKMHVDFGITVYAYRNSKKIDEIKAEKNYRWEKDEILAMKAIEFDIPYSINEKGKYYFDVIIEEKNSTTKYRDFAKYKR